MARYTTSYGNRGPLFRCGKHPAIPQPREDAVLAACAANIPIGGTAAMHRAANEAGVRRSRREPLHRGPRLLVDVRFAAAEGVGYPRREDMWRSGRVHADFR